MKRVIRHRTTHAFLTEEGQWSPDYNAAKIRAPLPFLGQECMCCSMTNHPIHDIASFLTEEGQWSPDYNAAKIFPDTKAVYEEFKLRELKEVESVLFSEDDPSEFYKPIIPL